MAWTGLRVAQRNERQRTFACRQWRAIALEDDQGAFTDR